MLGGQEQQEQEGQVGCGVADELDERLADEEAIAALGSHEVAQGEHRVEDADEDAGEKLPCPVAPPPAWKLVVPPGSQELLAVWLSYKLKEIKHCYTLMCLIRQKTIPGLRGGKCPIDNRS